MGDSELKEVRFDKYCKTCKHYEHKSPTAIYIRTVFNEDFSFEAQEPCNTCLEVGMREGTEKPEYWEEK